MMVQPQCGILRQSHKELDHKACMRDGAKGL